jgi:iron complex outermembrane receptor protein
MLLGGAHCVRGQVGAQSLEALLNTPINAASKYEQTMREAPASVTILTSDDIQRYGWRSLEEALQTVRGFYISDDRNYAYLGARGFGRPTDYNNRVLLLINGHTQNEDFYNSVALGSRLGLNIDAIERIEVVRGPGSSLYGTGAVFAVIDVITKDARAIDGLRISTEAGSFGRKGASAVYGGQIGERADLLLSAVWSDVGGQDRYYVEYDDPATNHGVAEDLDWDRVGGVHGSLYVGGLSAQAMFSSRKTGIPTGAYETAFNDRSASTLDEQAFIELRYASEPSVYTGVKARGYFDYYHYAGVYPYDDAPDWMDENDLKWGGLETQFRWDFREYNRLVVGVEAQRHFTVRYDSWLGDSHDFAKGFPFTLVSAYGQNTYQALTNLSITVGVRGDLHSTDDDSVSPRIGVIYDPLASSTIKLLYGEAFRVPTRYERFYENAGVFKANALISPESMRTVEAIWEQRIGRNLLGIASTYRYKMVDLIDATIDPDDELGVFENVSEVDAAGVEAELRVQLGARGRGYMSYAYQRAEDAASGLRLTNSPAHLARGGVVVPILSQLYAAANVVIESGRMTVYGTETDPLLLLNLNLSTTELFGGVHAALLVRNVLDESYAYPGGFEHLQPAILQNGRDVTLTIESRF